MGSAQSSETRSVQLDNPNPSSVIDISDEVVQRLKSGLKQQARENAIAAEKAKSKEATPPPAKEVPRVVPVKAAPPPPPPKSVAPSQPTVVYQSSQPTYVLGGGTTESAVDVRRQKQHELEENDAMWRKRMSQLEDTLKKTDSIMEKEYATAVEDVRKRFATPSPALKLPPCQDLKAQVIACYRAYPGETLKCAEEVALFQNCISAQRVLKLDADEAKTETATAKAA
ncbi:MICOS complex subunit Mic25 [Teleopsis dalmanni]|uniref:MICOS complex subunit Mic25 n=1 Tax=Teleopsis dalmanni TaxID=139649 RepID=UPI0018CFBA47|nr:MICOS complex subunit Mic25 [Teleopsis dalmanni]XP_037948174.1 MICOS complex subunit Mic25 [Teleopsis dalmanni]XP_037948175.1 MICOS complex subunit Mic25 [Teleopsis dalmanni]